MFESSVVLGSAKLQRSSCLNLELRHSDLDMDRRDLYQPIFASGVQYAGEVPLMRDVCSAASSVLIWLGEGSGAIERETAALDRRVALYQDDNWVFNGDDLHKRLPEAPPYQS